MAIATYWPRRGWLERLSREGSSSGVLGSHRSMLPHPQGTESWLAVGRKTLSGVLSSFIASIWRC